MAGASARRASLGPLLSEHRWCDLPKAPSNYVPKSDERVFETPQGIIATQTKGVNPIATVKKSHKKKPGRPTSKVQLALTKAFYDLGGVAALVRWGDEHPTDFYKLWARVLPHEIRANTQTINKSTQSNVQIEFVTRNDGGSSSGARVTIGNTAGETESAPDSEESGAPLLPQAQDEPLEGDFEIIPEPVTVEAS